MNGNHQEQLDQLFQWRYELAREVVNRQFPSQPVDETHGERERKLTVDDASINLEYLLTALKTDSQILFTQYLRWTQSLFQHWNLPPDTVADFFTITSQVLEDWTLKGWIDSSLQRSLKETIRQGLSLLAADSQQTHFALLPDENPLAEEMNAYIQHLLEKDRSSAIGLVNKLRQRPTDLRNLFQYLFYPAQVELGRLWQENRISVAQEHFATAATQYIMSLLYEEILSIPKKNRTLMGACVSGELHEMGIRMVCDYLECCQWHTFYLGANTPEKEIVRYAAETKPDVLAVSCTMTVHVPKVQRLVKDLKEQTQIPVVVGGYPFNADPHLWQKIGADGCAGHFAAIHDLVEQLTERGHA